MHRLDDLAWMKKQDPQDMLGRVSALAEESCEGLWTGLSWDIPKRKKNYDAVLVLGMGGSAIGADLLKDILQDVLPVPVWVNRSYGIPAWVNANTLVLVCSYSGNTEETLSAAKAALDTGATLFAITSGGKLATWAKRNSIPLQLIPTGLPPRTASGYLIFIPWGVFVQLGWITRNGHGLEEALDGLEKYIQTQLAPEVEADDNPAKQLALLLKGYMPVLYGAAEGWEGVVYRWKTQLEENAKTVAFHHIFPEATHNEISGWVQPKSIFPKTAALFLTDPSVHKQTLKRMHFTQQIIDKEGVPTLAIEVPGATRLQRLLRLIVLGDFVSVYLAFLYGADPTPVVRVEALKKYLNPKKTTKKKAKKK